MLSVYTRCQGCHTIHPVNAALLSRSGGRFRCGKCRKPGNMLDALFDQWPDPGQKPTPPGEPPELGAPLQIAAAEGTAPNGDGSLSGTASGRHLRLLWLAAAAILAVVITTGLARFLDLPLPGQDALQRALVGLGLAQAPSARPFRDPGKLEVVSRELRPHPVRPGVLRLDATIVNRAQQAQAYPVIEITLLNLQSQEIAKQRFAPGDYLSGSGAAQAGMPPNAYLPLYVEMIDPGETAVGFELEFR